MILQFENKRTPEEILISIFGDKKSFLNPEILPSCVLISRAKANTIAKLYKEGFMNNEKVCRVSYISHNECTVKFFYGSEAEKSLSQEQRGQCIISAINLCFKAIKTTDPK